MVSGKLALGGFAASALLAVAPANADVATFADYKAIGLGSNIYWKNDGTTSSNGNGGSIYTISSGIATDPGSALISFSFLDPALAAVTNVTAAFTLLASVTDTPTFVDSGYDIQTSIVGSFSIKSTTAITISGVTYAAGANLLSGDFDEGAIFGMDRTTSGSFSSSTAGGATITYTSDFLSFAPTVDRDFSLGLTSITPRLRTFGGALRTFGAVSTGSFSSDPAPVPIAGVPEPTSWAMFIGGFGLLGTAMRRRRAEPQTA